MGEDKMNSKKMKIEAIPAPVSHALIMICDKCGRKLESDDEKNPSRLMQKQLKHEMKEKFGKGYARAVTTSCLDVCPKNQIAVGIADLNSTSQPVQFFLVEGQDPAADCAAILGKLDSKPTKD